MTPEVENDFRNAGIDPNSEDDLIGVIENESNKYLVWLACLRLQESGTIRSILALKRAVYYPATDVKISALYAIAAIAKEAESDYYLEILQDTKYREKFSATDIIVTYCGKEALAPMIKRLKSLISGSKKKPTPVTMRVGDRHYSELSRILEWLNKNFRGYPEVEKTMNILTDKWSLLSEHEKELIKHIIPNNRLSV